MTVYIVLVANFKTAGLPVSIDVYQSLKDAEERRSRAERNFPEGEGYYVTLIEQWASNPSDHFATLTIEALCTS